MVHQVTRRKCRRHAKTERNWELTGNFKSSGRRSEEVDARCMAADASDRFRSRAAGCYTLYATPYLRQPQAQRMHVAVVWRSRTIDSDEEKERVRSEWKEKTISSHEFFHFWLFCFERSPLSAWVWDWQKFKTYLRLCRQSVKFKTFLRSGKGFWKFKTFQDFKTRVRTLVLKDLQLTCTAERRRKRRHPNTIVYSIFSSRIVGFVHVCALIFQILWTKVTQTQVKPLDTAGIKAVNYSWPLTF